MKGVRRLALVVCGLAGKRSPRAAQDPQKPPQTPLRFRSDLFFRAGVDVVRVDVYPRRRDRIRRGFQGRGLSADRRRCTPDDRDVQVHRNRHGPWRGAAGLRNASEAQRMAADPRNRVFVFYLDTYAITMEGSARAREPLLHFLQGSMGPRDLFAWMEPKHSPEFLEFTRMTQDGDADDSGQAVGQERRADRGSVRNETPRRAGRAVGADWSVGVGWSVDHARAASSPPGGRTSGARPEGTHHPAGRARQERRTW